MSAVQRAVWQGAAAKAALRAEPAVERPQRSQGVRWASLGHR
ncbi:hypothetical protein [Nocardioides panacihumi]